MKAPDLLTEAQRAELEAWFRAELKKHGACGGYAVGSRRESALVLKKRNDERARAAWLRHIPQEPKALVVVLREAGVDLDELRMALSR